MVLADGNTMFLTRSTASVSHRPYGECKIIALYFYKGVLTGSEKIFLRLAMVTSVVKNLTLTDRIPQPLYLLRKIFIVGCGRPAVMDVFQKASSPENLFSLSSHPLAYASSGPAVTADVPSRSFPEALEVSARLGHGPLGRPSGHREYPPR